MAEEAKCKKKDDEVNVVTVSDSVVKRLQSGQGDAKNKEAKKAETDEQWIKKLKCMDDFHTKEHGLTSANFNKV